MKGGLKRGNALSAARTLGDAGALDATGDSDHDYASDDGARAQRFATDLEGNTFREVSLSI